MIAFLSGLGIIEGKMGILADVAVMFNEYQPVTL